MKTKASKAKGKRAAKVRDLAAQKGKQVKGALLGDIVVVSSLKPKRY